MTSEVTNTEKKESNFYLRGYRTVNQRSFILKMVRSTVAEPDESLFKCVSIVIMMGKVGLTRMGGRWQTHSLQGEEVRSLNQCVNRGGSYSRREC